MSQKLVPYERYKDSGVEWLGQIPECWGKKRLRFLFEIKKRIAGSEDFDVLSITQRGIKVKDLENNDGQISMDYTKYQFVEIGDFAMNHMDLLTGWIDISPHFGVTSPDYRVFSMQGALEAFPRYFLYLLQMGYKEKIFYSYGQGSSQLGRWRLPTEQFQDITFPFPSPADQQAISTYLDKQTSRIDALVKEQEELILLLKEKRQALISHAATKGLDPNATMKPSGVEWIGEIPEGWTVTALKFVVAMQSGDQITSEEIGEQGDFPVYGGNGLRGFTGSFNHDGFHVLIGRQGALCGNINYADGKFWASEHAVVVTPIKELNQLWLGVLLEAMNLGQYSTSAAQPGLSVEAIGNLRVPIPPLDEQNYIWSKIDSLQSSTKELVSEAESTITLMQEHRSALISAVVTGKVRVPA